MNVEDPEHQFTGRKQKHVLLIPPVRFCNSLGSQLPPCRLSAGIPQVCFFRPTVNTLQLAKPPVKKNKTISHSTMPFTVSAVSKQAINSSSTTPNQNGHPRIIREDNDMHTSKHRRTPYGVRKHPGQENCVYAPLLFAFLLPNLAAIVWNSAGPQLVQCKCHWLLSQITNQTPNLLLYPFWDHFRSHVVVFCSAPM